MCPVQEPCCYVKGQVHSSYLQFMKPYLCLADNFVVGPASEMVIYGSGFPSVCTVPSRRCLTQGTRQGHQCPMDTFLL